MFILYILTWLRARAYWILSESDAKMGILAMSAKANAKSLVWTEH